jgi:hypothetical protein
MNCYGNFDRLFQDCKLHFYPYYDYLNTICRSASSRTRMNSMTLKVRRDVPP